MYIDMKIAQSIQRDFRRDAAIKRVADPKRSAEKRNVHKENLVQLTTSLAALTILVGLF